MWEFSFIQLESFSNAPKDILSLIPFGMVHARANMYWLQQQGTMTNRVRHRALTSFLWLRSFFIRGYGTLMEFGPSVSTQVVHRANPTPKHKEGIFFFLEGGRGDAVLLYHILATYCHSTFRSAKFDQRIR